MKGFIDLLKSNFAGYSDKEKSEMIGMISESAENVYSLIDNLLNWSRSQRRTINFSPQLTDIRILINEKIELLHDQATTKKIVLSSDCNSDEMLLEIDAELIKVVIQNLLTNAIKFTHTGGKVQVRCQVEENTFLLSVTDTGTGMSQDLVRKLFRPDIQISKKGTENESGTGLGMMICKDFVELHHGKIWVESELGAGSTFFIHLPVRQV